MGWRTSTQGRQYGFARLMGFGALLLAILACGGPPPREMIPVATLEPDVAPFRVVSFAGTALQARAGRDGALQWSTPIDAKGPALLIADAGVIYLSARSAPMVTAIRASDGHILWQFTDCTGSDNR